MTAVSNWGTSGPQPNVEQEPRKLPLDLFSTQRELAR